MKKKLAINNKRAKDAEPPVQLQAPASPRENIEQGEGVAFLFHEVRTSLTGAFGHIQLMQSCLNSLLNAVKKYEKDGDMQCNLSLLSLALQELNGHLAIINHCSNDQLVILNHVLDFKKLEQNHFELEPKSFFIIQDVFQPLKAMYINLSKEKSIKFVTQWPEKEQALIGDAHWLKQVLANLLANALKFTKPAGKKSARIDLILNMKQKDLYQEVNFKVKNTGIGLSQETIDQLFKPFRQAGASIRHEFGGTGLGLVVCKQILALMKGSIICTSSVSDHWVQFEAKLNLPIAKLPTVPAFLREEEKAKYSQPGLKASVLLVEDNLINLKLTKNMLEKWGCTVDIASNGREAVAKAKEKTYSVILMDNHMPEMDGFAATQAIRKIEKECPPSKSVPIIGLSADSSEKKTRGTQAGMNEFLLKPVSAKDLYNAISPYCEILASCTELTPPETYKDLFYRSSSQRTHHSPAMFARRLELKEENGSRSSSPRSSISISSRSDSVFSDKSSASPFTETDLDSLVDLESLFPALDTSLPEPIQKAYGLAKNMKEPVCCAQVKLQIIGYYFSQALKEKSGLEENNLEKEIHSLETVYSKLTVIKEQAGITIAALGLWQSLQDQALPRSPLLTLAKSQLESWKSRFDHLEGSLSSDAVSPTSTLGFTR